MWKCEKTKKLVCSAFQFVFMLSTATPPSAILSIFYDGKIKINPYRHWPELLSHMHLNANKYGIIKVPHHSQYVRSYCTYFRGVVVFQALGDFPFFVLVLFACLWDFFFYLVGLNSANRKKKNKQTGAKGWMNWIAFTMPIFLLQKGSFISLISLQLRCHWAQIELVTKLHFCMLGNNIIFF